jgi:hypothetical protein
MTNEQILELALRFGGFYDKENLIAFAQAIIDAERENCESKYKDAIQNCIGFANGRESEWGERAESAFEFLYAALEED